MYRLSFILFLINRIYGLSTHCQVLLNGHDLGFRFHPHFGIGHLSLELLLSFRTVQLIH